MFAEVVVVFREDVAVRSPVPRAQSGATILARTLNNTTRR